MIVYLLRNTANGKCYVGQTHHNSITKRWRGRFTGCKPNLHMSAAIRKYGTQAFEAEILARCKTQEEADAWEKLWICLLGTQNRELGYNEQGGGRAGLSRHTAATRKQIAASMKALWRSRTKKERKAIKAKIRKAWAASRQMHLLAISRGLLRYYADRAKRTSKKGKKRRKGRKKR